MKAGAIPLFSRVSMRPNCKSRDGASGRQQLPRHVVATLILCTPHSKPLPPWRDPPLSLVYQPAPINGLTWIAPN